MEKKRIRMAAGMALLALAVTVPAAAADETTVDASKGGVTFRSGDNSLTIGARAQFRWTVDDKEQFDADTAGSGDGQEDGVSSAFDIPRMRVKLSGGMFKPWLKYEFQYEFSRTSGQGSSKLKDAVLEIEKVPMAGLKLGQFKVPFSLQELTSSGNQQFVDRAVTNAKFAPARDVGVALQGRTEDKRFGYAVGAFNGAGESSQQEDQGHMFVGRIWIDPLGEYKYSESAVEAVEKPVLHLGLAARTGEVQRGTDTSTVFEDPNDQTAYNAEIAWKTSRFFATGEYFRMTDEQENPAAGPDLDSDGFHAQAGYMVSPKRIELGLRYAQVDPNQDVDDDAVSEIRGVFGYFWKEHKLKLQADVGQVRYDSAYGSSSALALRGLPALGSRLVSGQELEDDQFRLQMQLAF